MRGFLAGFLLWASTGVAIAKDTMLILDDQHRQDLLTVIDQSLKMQGVNILPQANRLIELLNKASTVVDQKQDSSPNKGTERKD